MDDVERLVVELWAEFDQLPEDCLELRQLWLRTIESLNPLPTDAPYLQ